MNQINPAKIAKSEPTKKNYSPASQGTGFFYVDSRLSQGVDRLRAFVFSSNFGVSFPNPRFKYPFSMAGGFQD